jgi:hypothetical protein
MAVPAFLFPGYGKRKDAERFIDYLDKKGASKKKGGETESTGTQTCAESQIKRGGSR